MFMAKSKCKSIYCLHKLISFFFNLNQLCFLFIHNPLPMMIRGTFW